MLCQGGSLPAALKRMTWSTKPPPVHRQPSHASPGSRCGAPDKASPPPSHPSLPIHALRGGYVRCAFVPSFGYPWGGDDEAEYMGYVPIGQWPSEPGRPGIAGLNPTEGLNFPAVPVMSDWKP
eukprot:122508-Chlamydomonas_euryale.AAC.3